MRDKPLRETQPVRALGYFTGAWAVLFATCVMIMGDKLTSKQWVYLMSFPGGKWFWGAAYMIVGGLVLYGLTRNKYRTVGAGLFVCGFLCTAIAVFYAAAPLIGPDLLTLGSWPWMGFAIPLWGAAAVNWIGRAW